MSKALLRITTNFLRTDQEIRGITRNYHEVTGNYVGNSPRILEGNTNENKNKKTKETTKEPAMENTYKIVDLLALPALPALLLQRRELSYYRSSRPSRRGSRNS